MKNLAKHIISYIMCINYWYDQNILPFFEERASKKIFIKYKRKELAILSIMLDEEQNHCGCNDFVHNEYWVKELQDIKVKLNRFKNKGHKWYTDKVMSVSGRLQK